MIFEALIISILNNAPLFSDISERFDNDHLALRHAMERICGVQKKNHLITSLSHTTSLLITVLTSFSWISRRFAIEYVVSTITTKSAHYITPDNKELSVLYDVVFFIK